MSLWKQALLGGSTASVLSAAALVLCSRRRPAAPVNAISHWVWGDAAFSKDRATLRHTLLGYVIHHAASLFWSTLHARMWGPPNGMEFGKAAVTAATAAVVDYTLTPRRFTPGFEQRLSRKQMVVVYACFALGLAIGRRVQSANPAIKR